MMLQVWGCLRHALGETDFQILDDNLETRFSTSISICEQGSIREEI
jgi:hypothetical protein